MTIRAATPADAPLIATLVRELADYEQLAHEAVATIADFEKALFGPNPKAHALIVEHEGQTAGFAIYFYNFSTFLGRPGIYVEDVYIRPDLDGITAGDFERSEEAIARGYVAAASAEAELRRLAVTDAQYAAWQRSTARQASAALASWTA